MFHHHTVPFFALRFGYGQPAPRPMIWLAVTGALCALGAFAAVVAIPLLALLDHLF